MGSNAPALMKYLDRPRGEPDPDLFAQQVVWGRVKVFADLYVVVETDSALLPFRKNVWLGRQRLQGSAFDLIKDWTCPGFVPVF